MKPICFVCRKTVPQSPAEIVDKIMDTANWSDFQGYGVLPGIRSATFEVRSPDVVGSRIKVSNSDGSSHVEEIVEWLPERRLTLRMHEFSPPVSRLATHFIETWEFEPAAEGTRVARAFELYAANALTRPVLWGVSKLLERAIDRHLEQITGDVAVK